MLFFLTVLKYAKFLVLVQKLADHLMSKREADYLKQFVTPFVPPIKLSEIPAVSFFSFFFVSLRVINEIFNFIVDS